ncbi:hypothetical protein GIB67_025455 [Kingdonia uniflora]|uniref:Rab escort protein 1 n=1 Tax=Kingdonia uniflora TaxID=39325 RepID=A0A7J7N1L5_9MAGN|nr:hypothetical protein GIB67_025455 [Kingdonia uniflora]
MADYPSIDPSSFDLIVIGTGLPESILASASATAGKTVLHLDPNSFYGNHFSSLPLDHFSSFLQSHSHCHSQQPNISPPTSSSNCLHLKHNNLFSHVHISNPHSEYLGPSNKFSLDLSGPKLLFCADPMVNIMLKSGATYHIEFKGVDATYVYRGDGDDKLMTVPDSRSAIFKSSVLTLKEKRQLMSFFKTVQEHILELEAALTSNEEMRRARTISDEELECPFIDFLTTKGLPSNIKSIILYAIAMADYDQETPLLRKDFVIKTKDGIKSLALHNMSLGRFVNASGALIYPIYGQGELSQAFCRCAAVKGALYVLRMPVTALLIDKESNCYKGVRLASGQELFSHHLVMSPSFTVPLSSTISSIRDVQGDSSESSSRSDVEGLVARAVCITRVSIKPDLSNLLIIFPPRSLYPEQMTSVRALQLGSGLAVCPPGLFVLYISTMCDAVAQGKELLHAAMNALAHLLSRKHESSTTMESDCVEEDGPNFLWSAIYVQELRKGSSEIIVSCPTPDGRLDYRDMLDSTIKLFHEMYAEVEFFPETEDAENAENDE